MHPSLFDWSNVLLMDSLTQKPRYQSRRLLTRQRKHDESKGGRRKGISQHNKANDGSKKEYDTWNMITETLNQQLITAHQIHRRSDDIGIQDKQTNNIQLIHDRQQFNQLMLVGKKGLKVRAENLIGPNDLDNSFALRVNFRLVPVIEGITIAKGYEESSYTFEAGNNENNNNIDLNAVEAMEVSHGCEADSTLICDVDSSVGSLEFTDMYVKINNTVNISAAPHVYDDFFKDIQSEATKILRSGNDNVPMFSTPKK